MNNSIFWRLPAKSHIFLSFSLPCTHIEELTDNFKGHALCFRYLEINKEPRDDANHGIDAKYSGEPYRGEQSWERVRDNDISKPEGKRTYGNAKATDTSREDFRAEDIWNGAKTHDKAAEVDYNTDSR